jgi:hypothetical protein
MRLGPAARRSQLERSWGSREDREVRRIGQRCRNSAQPNQQQRVPGRRRLGRSLWVGMAGRDVLAGAMFRGVPVPMAPKAALVVF